MKNLFTDLESQFERLDAKSNELLRDLEQKALNASKRIDNTYQTSYSIIRKIFNLKREELISQVEKSFRESLKSLHRQDVLFRSSSICLTRITTLILGQLKYENEFDIVKKFRYLELFNFFVELEIAHDQIDYFDVRITALSQHKLFIYSKRDCFLKIVNQKCEELSSRTIDKKLVFKSIICYDPWIATLFQDSVTKKYYLTIYDDSLNVISYKSFKFDNEESYLNLCSLDSKQVVCWMRNIRKCIIYDHKLNELAQLGQDTDISKPFYFCNTESNDGFLLDISDRKILFYFHDKTNNSNSIKIINRDTGLLDGIVDIPGDSVSKLIKFDSKSNIVMKRHPDVSIFLFDSNGNLLMSRTTTQFTNLIRFDISRNDEIVCYDTNKDKLFYF